ncbi:MAG: bacterial Ig-like domain-containing protein, partial [Firmicutes bacterium]|nr:bacterial Ig-like domain-containing protein [Bacillota bacterium]
MKKFKFLGVLIIAAMMALALLACQDDKPPKIPDEEIEVNLADLKITVHPEKLIYNVGEDFEPGELEVTAIYSDKTEKVIPHNQLTITPKSFTAAGPNVEVTISYRESNIAKQVSEWVVVNALADELYSIAVTNPPSKTDYVAGDLFIPIGLSVLATYNSGGEAGKLTTKSIPVGDARLSYRPEGPLPAGATTLTVICTENGVSKSATVSITVATIVGLQITSPPEKDRYNAGEAFDKTGMEVTALFLNGEKPPMVVNPSLYTVEPAVLTGTETEVMVKYSGESESVPVAVVSNITIETPPTKELLYNSGDTFKPDGMVLNVEYTDGVVVKETIAAGMAECTPENVPTPTNPDGTVVITIKYRGKTTTIPVEVVTVVSVKISKQPGKTTYYSGDPFITGGMEVEAEYSNGDKKLVSFSNDPADGYNYSPREVKTGRDIVITYGGKAVVVEGLNVIAMVLQVESGTYKANYKAGETFNAAGMKVYKGFMDGPGGTVGTKTEIPAAQYQVVTPGVLSATNKTVKVRYDGEESDVPIRVGVLSALEVTPGKTAYLEGKLFETTGMVVRAVYSDGEGSDGVVLRETKSPGATGYTISNPSFLAPAETSVSVVYTDFGVTKSEPVTITVSAFVDFEFTPASSGVYYEGDTFDPKDLEVRAVYANGEKELLSHGANGYRVNGSVNYTEKMRAGNTFFTVSYPVGNRPTAPSTFRWIKVYPVTAVTVEGAFAKTYLDGIDKFNRAGMTVKATYDVDGTPETKVITDYTWTDSILTAANKVVTVSYMGKEFRIEDITILTLRSVTATLKNPSYEYIISGDTLEKSDMVVAAVYGAGEGAGEITSSINNVPAGDYEINIAGDRLSAAAGVQNSFTVTYKGMTSSPVGIMVKQVVGFTVTGPKVYYVGDRVQKDDLTVTIAYNRGTSPEVIPSSGFAVTPTAALAVGDTIEVVYKGLTRKTDIVVGENVGLNLTTVPLTPGGTYTLTSARLAG